MVLTLLIVGGAGFAIWWIGTTAFDDISRLTPRLPRMIQDAIRGVAGTQGIDLFGAHYSPEQISQAMIAGTASSLNAAQVMLAVKIRIGSAAGLVLTFGAGPVFPDSGPRLWEGALWLVPPERRHSVREMLPALVPSCAATWWG